MAKLLALTSFISSQEAYLAKAYLESEGIDVFINDDFMARAGYLAATGGIRLMVPDDQLLKAKHVLADYLNVQTMVGCPQCSSTDTRELPWRALSFKQKINQLFKGQSFFVCGNCSEGFTNSTPA